MHVFIQITLPPPCREISSDDRSSAGANDEVGRGNIDPFIFESFERPCVPCETDESASTEDEGAPGTRYDVSAASMRRSTICRTPPCR